MYLCIVYLYIYMYIYIYIYIYLYIPSAEITGISGSGFTCIYIQVCKHTCIIHCISADSAPDYQKRNVLINKSTKP